LTLRVRIKMEIPTFEDPKLPEVLLKTIMENAGLVLFVGGNSARVSPLLAASLIDYRNRNSSGISSPSAPDRSTRT
jgi:twitching motility protein PilU